MRICNLKKMLYYVGIISLVSSFGSCNTDESIPVLNQDELEYEVALSSRGGIETVYFEDLNFPVTVSLEDETWLSYEVKEREQGGVSILLKCTELFGQEIKSQRITITDRNHKSHIVRVSRAVTIYDSENGEDLEFLTNWENCDSVFLYYDHRYVSVATPWHKKASNTTMPAIIRKDVKKEDGWEMAFSTLGKTDLEGTNYFGLYNKWSGILRIFYYVSSSLSTASEYCLEVDMGTKQGDMKYPFHNALNYALPFNEAVNNAVDLNNVGVSTTFKTFLTPHTNSSSTALTIGWTAFDLDASGYCPDGKDWKNSEEEFMFQIKSTTTSLITLCGDITAGIEGNFSQIEENTASSTSGVATTFKQIGKYSSMAAKPVGAIFKAACGKDISGALNTIAGIANFAGSVTESLAKNNYAETKVDSMAGKIELSMTGNVNLEGVIKSVASNSCPPLTITTESFRSGHFGEGIWGLKKSPVVYYISDCMLGNTSSFHYSSVGGGKYAVDSIALNNCMPRILTFLDPMSIKLAINPKLFPNPEDLEILVSCIGAYPDEVPGHTAKYHQVLGHRTEKFSISALRNNYKQLNPDSLLIKEFGENINNCDIYPQKGTNYSYYGLRNDDYGKGFIVDPQIFIPSTKSNNGNYIYDFEIPDLVVNVTIRFKSHDRYFIFSKRYVPHIESMDTRALYEYIGDGEFPNTEFDDYMDNCKNNRPVDYVNGQPLRNPSGTLAVERMLRYLFPGRNK